MYILCLCCNNCLYMYNVGWGCVNIILYKIVYSIKTYRHIGHGWGNLASEEYDVRVKFGIRLHSASARNHRAKSLSRAYISFEWKTQLKYS